MNNPFHQLAIKNKNIYIYTYNCIICINIYNSRASLLHCRIYVVKFGLWLIWGLSGFRSVVVGVGVRGGSLITFEGSWKTQWSDFFHAASQQIQAVCCWASLSILKTLFPAPTVFFSTNQSGLKAPSSLPPRSLALDLIPRGWIHPDWCTQQKGIIPDYMSVGRQC